MVDPDQLTKALVAATPVLDDLGSRLALETYRTLALGSPVSDAVLAAAAGLETAQVRSVLAGWPGVFRDDADRIVGFWGLALAEMPHTLEVNGIRLYAWCAYDTLFLPGVLGGTALVTSSDPQSGETVTLTVTPDKVTDRSHEQMVVSFLAPPDQGFDDDVMTSFCHYIHFFVDRSSAAPWMATHKQTFSIDVDQAFQIGQRWNEARGLA